MAKPHSSQSAGADQVQPGNSPPITREPPVPEKLDSKEVATGYPDKDRDVTGKASDMNKWEALYYGVALFLVGIAYGLVLSQWISR